MENEPARKPTGGNRIQGNIVLLGDVKETGFIKNALAGTTSVNATNEQQAAPNYWNKVMPKFIKNALADTTSVNATNEQQAAPNYWNKVMPDIYNTPGFNDIIRYKLGSHSPEKVKAVEWNWEQEVYLEGFDETSSIIICKVPVDDNQWRAVKKIRERCNSPVYCIHEVILPFTAIQASQAAFYYYMKTLEEIIPYYFGDKYWGPIAEVDALFTISGKTVIEFGPLDGAQTSGLIKAGAKSVTCIEARAENVIKCLVAGYVLNWTNVLFRMDDFHNVNSLTYGKFDLAFAHGVYYHSESPFLFLENLLSLSDCIFLGGFCATDSLPGSEYLMLEHCGKKYRAKMYEEVNNATAGINRYGYFFHKDDLMSFFRERGCDIVLISDEECTVTAGNYLRILITQKVVCHD